MSDPCALSPDGWCLTCSTPQGGPVFCGELPAPLGKVPMLYGCGCGEGWDRANDRCLSQSDILTPVVSHNDSIKNVASLEADAISEGYAEGLRDGRAEVLPILRDLITELRELATCDIDLGNQTDPETIAFLLDRAEARLKGLNDE